MPSPHHHLLQGGMTRAGGTEFAYGAAEKSSKGPYGGLGMLQGVAATRVSPLQVDNTVCL